MAVSSGRVFGNLASFKTTYCVFLTAYLVLIVPFAIGADATTIADVHSAFMQKDYAKASELAQTLSEQARDSQEKAEALYYAGLSDLWLGKYLSARRMIEQSLDAKPSKSLQDMASLALVDTYYMEGDYKRSLRLAEDFLYGHPKSDFLSLAYLKIARSHLKLANWKKGREYLQEIVKKFPNSPERFYVEQLLNENQFFAVQVGSFQDRVTAEGIVGKLQKEGEYAYIVETTSQDGKKFFRVRAGKFQQFDEAQQLEAKLSKLGYPTKIYP
jgi:tetratricopeptide (TPR) repeat protein